MTITSVVIILLLFWFLPDLIALALIFGAIYLLFTNLKIVLLILFVLLVLGILCNTGGKA